MNKINKRRTPVLTLYRGKRKDTEEWIESFNINSQTDIRGFRHIYLGLNVRSVSHPQQVTIEWVEVITDTVGRWSKLYDTYNSREKLFEGDVVECDLCRPDGEPTTKIMVIKDVTDYRDICFLDMGCDGIKLLGNIFDEPKYAKYIGGLADDSTKWLQMFNRFLETVEFVLIKYGDNRWGLVDSTGTNLANIEDDRFCDAAGIAERLDNYISDYFISDIDNALEEKGVEVNWQNSLEAYLDNAKELLPDFASDFEILDMLCNHIEEINLNDCRYEEREEYLKEDKV